MTFLFGFALLGITHEHGMEAVCRAAAEIGAFRTKRMGGDFTPYEFDEEVS